MRKPSCCHASLISITHPIPSTPRQISQSSIDLSGFCLQRQQFSFLSCSVWIWVFVTCLNGSGTFCPPEMNLSTYQLLQWGRFEVDPWVDEEVPPPGGELAASRALVRHLSLKLLPDNSACNHLPNSFSLTGNKVKNKQTNKSIYLPVGHNIWSTPY